MEHAQLQSRKALEEAQKQIDILKMDLETAKDKLNIKETLLLVNNKEMEEINAQLVDTLKKLDKANEKLKEMDKRKSAFVSHVSHEFKNPLFIIQESASVVLDEDMGSINEKQKEFLGFIKNSTDRMLRLVIDLLDISKIEAGKMELRREEIGVISLVSEILLEYEGQISKKQLNLKKEISGSVGIIWADKDKIIEVITNLLSNAIKYTPEGRDIFIKLEGTQKEIRFEIADTGPGIPTEDFDKIFDKFERITAERQEGTGLGLPIAKDIIKLHKGEIWIESEIGKGSKFIFTLPRNI